MGEGLAGAGRDLLLLLAIAGVLVCGALVLVPGFLDSQADADLARAEVVRQEAGLVEARTARDREANLHREQMFAMLALAFKSESRGGDIGSVLLGAGLVLVCGLGVIVWMRRQAWYME